MFDRSGLLPYLESNEHVSEVLNGKRGHSLEMTPRLHTGLGIPVDLLVGKQVQKPARGKSHWTEPIVW